MEENINKRTFKQKMASRRKDPISLILFCLVYLATILTFLVIAFIVGYILVMGIPNLNMSLFSWTYTTENVSLLPALINTIFTRGAS